jgi:hypothetical protein
MRREKTNVYSVVIPGRAKREPGIHRAAEQVLKWIPGLRQEGASSGAQLRTGE